MQMLAADKSALERNLQRDVLEIQWKELEYLHNNFQNLATSSALLLGFGFTALGSPPYYRPRPGLPAANTTQGDGSIWTLSGDAWASPYVITSILLRTLYMGTASFALAYNLLSLFISTTSIMCGPGMALRGPEGSVSVAVRHLELQLKRALRFFGRGVVAFTLLIALMGIRRLHSIAFAGGLISIVVAAWTLYSVWKYGTDIAEKFHVSPTLAVRGVFVQGADGQPRWQNTENERIHGNVHAGFMLFGIELGRRVKRWRPQGHGRFTPLWRLDKLIAFPYMDEARSRRSISGSQASPAARDACLLYTSPSPRDS